MTPVFDDILLVGRVFVKSRDPGNLPSFGDPCTWLSRREDFYYSILIFFSVHSGNMATRRDKSTDNMGFG